jgi:hypothetical protein
MDSANSRSVTAETADVDVDLTDTVDWEERARAAEAQLRLAAMMVASALEVFEQRHPQLDTLPRGPGTFPL